MIYKCRNCASALKYDIHSGKLICAYCGSSYEESDFSEVKGKAEDKYEEESAADNQTMSQNVYVCSACGAKLMINNVEAATYCAFCGQPTIVFDRVSQIRKPDYIIPFKVTREEAGETIQEKLRKGFFVPKGLKNITPTLIRGVYMPYMFFDVSHKAEILLKGTVKQGKSSKTEYFFRRVHCDFKNLGADTSARLNDLSAERLEPFDTSEFKIFDAGFLSGFYADCSDEESNDVNSKTLLRATHLVDEAAKKTVQASDITVEKARRDEKICGQRYVMVPVWYYVCKYENKNYTMMVNGQTGKAIGAVPFAKAKVTVAAAMLFAILSVLLTAGGFFLGEYVMEDVEDVYKIILILATFLVGLVTAVFKKKEAYETSRWLTSQNTIYEIAADRQGDR